MSNLSFMMITDSPQISAYVENNGVERIFMDREIIGKLERQQHLNTHIASHSYSSIKAVSKVLKSAELMVRVNPLNVGTRDEIEQTLDSGATRLMLPMFTRTSEVEAFLRYVDNRVPVTFLAETPQALLRLPDWITCLNPGFDEVHVGLNDLSISLGANFLFEPLAGGLLEPLSEELNRRNIRWGFGGISKISDFKSIAPAKYVLSEHVRLGSRWAILSRAFHEGASDLERLLEIIDFRGEIESLREAEVDFQSYSREDLDKNRTLLSERIFRHVRNT
jgi:hypothetical protein